VVGQTVQQPNRGTAGDWQAADGARGGEGREEVEEAKESREVSHT
jgi:hypothetical protein